LTKQIVLVKAKLASLYIFINKEKQLKEKNNLVIDTYDCLDEDVIEEGSDILLNNNAIK
jgi:hypothetical protein